MFCFLLLKLLQSYSFYLNYNHFSSTFFLYYSFGSIILTLWCLMKTETLMSKEFFNPIDSAKFNQTTYEKQSD